MANVPYGGGVPDVRPDARPPSDYQEIQANPAQFGALIGQGEEKLGAGLSTAGKFWGQVQTDGVMNDYLKQGDQAVESFKNLHGQDALDAQPGLNKQLDDGYQQARNLLSTPEQQLQFDNQTRPYRDRYWAGQISTHSNQQAYAYGTKTNTDALEQANNMAANSIDSPAQIAVARAKARAASYKQVQMDGQENNPDAVNAAAQKADMSVYGSVAEAMAVKNPLGAQKFVEDHKADLGPRYAPLAEQIRVRADKAIGESTFNEEYGKAVAKPGKGYANPALPVFAQAASSVPGSASPGGLARLVQIESSGNPNAGAGSSHQGLVQASDGWWRQFGAGGDKFNPQDAIMAAARSTAHDRPILAGVLGRQPTDAELYIAHQQGPGGAAKLFSNPNARAGDLVGDQAIRGNGGDPNAPASAFTNMWTAKFGGAHGLPSIGGGQTMTLPAVAANAGAPAAPDLAPAPPDVTPIAPIAGGTPPTAPGTPPAVPAPPAAPAPIPATAEETLAHTVAGIEARTDRTPDQKAYAVAQARQHYATAQIAEEQTAKAKKAASDAAANQYMAGFMKGDTDPSVIGKIADDPHLTWETKHSLWDLAKKATGENDPAVFGKGFNDVYQRILADPNDPNRIADPVQILKMGAAGGSLTFAGTQKALTILNETKKSVDGYGIQSVKAGAVNNAKKYLSFEEDLGYGAKRRDPEGEKIFDTQFLPRFESAYDDWTMKQGKDPHEFPLFDPKKMDAFLQQLRPKRARDAALLAADREDVAPAPGAPQPIPPPPPEVDPDGWIATLRAPPVYANGTPWPVSQWQSVVDILRKDPSPTNIQKFDSKFGVAGYRAKDILGRLAPKPPPTGPQPVRDMTPFELQPF